MNRNILFFGILLALAPFLTSAANYELCLKNTPAGGGSGTLTFIIKNNTASSILFSNLETSFTVTPGAFITDGTNTCITQACIFTASPIFLIAPGSSAPALTLTYGGASNANAVSVATANIVVNGVTYMSNADPNIFAVTCPTAILPVELLSFSAEKKGAADVLLNWTTASERQTSRFEIERRNGESAFWTNTGALKAAGNSLQKRDYTFTDANATASGLAVYYRLKIVDNDETFQYSPVRSVFLDSKGVALLYPNPATFSTHLSFPGAEDGRAVTLMLTASTGKTVLKKNGVGGEHDLEIESLPAGLYLLQAFSENGDRITAQKLTIY